MLTEPKRQFLIKHFGEETVKDIEREMSKEARKIINNLNLTTKGWKRQPRKIVNLIAFVVCDSCLGVNSVYNLATNANTCDYCGNPI